MALDLNSPIYQRCFTAQFGESVVYHPRTGSPRRITAVVNRDESGGIDTIAGTQHPRPLMQVEVTNDPATGISSNEINLGGDRLELSIREGGEPSLREIANIITQDAGSMLLEVR